MNRKLLLLPIIYLLSNWCNLVDAETRNRDGDSRKFQLCPVVKVSSSKNPTMDAGRLNINLLMDGKLPKDGWRSTWTAWFKVDPVLTFDSCFLPEDDRPPISERC